MQLSERLRAVASLVTPGSRLADVGTDHAYVPIWLWEQGRIPSAIAMDVGKGPLSRAEEHIRAHHGEDVIETRLSDGLEKLFFGECDSLVIAGMGGMLMRKILADGQALLPGIRELVLQPQSDIHEVRRFLQGAGWQIMDEKIVFEEGKYYPMFRAVQGAVEHDREIWFRYGRILLERKDPVLKQYLEKEERICEAIAGKLWKTDTDGARGRLREIEDKLGLIREALAYFK
ncbi:MAG: SAM-dependent methyltransferase [Lachnospiraceae bacterium]|nr:SAM-dependent methyltransferase [Lachnospiraceae bacterium]